MATMKSQSSQNNAYAGNTGYQTNAGYQGNAVYQANTGYQGNGQCQGPMPQYPYFMQPSTNSAPNGGSALTSLVYPPNAHPPYPPH